MKCSVCGGAVRKYAPSGDLKRRFWYECVGCGLRMKECNCAVEI